MSIADIKKNADAKMAKSIEAFKNELRERFDGTRLARICGGDLLCHLQGLCGLALREVMLDDREARLQAAG